MECICGQLRDPGNTLCSNCRQSISESQRIYLKQFEALLRTGRGIDICMEIAGDIGITYRRKVDKYPDLSGRKGTKLCEDDVREIRKLAKNGMTNKDIASIYKVCAETVSSIKYRKSWSDVV